jgi:4-coumarate--CoA ligase
VAKFGSVGALLPNIQARLMVEVSGTGGGAENPKFRDAKDGEEGEMWLKGPTITKVLIFFLVSSVFPGTDTLDV